MTLATRNSKFIGFAAVLTFSTALTGCGLNSATNTAATNGVAANNGLFQSTPGFQSIPGVQVTGLPQPGVLPQGVFPQGLLPNAVAGFQQVAPQFQVNPAAWGQQLPPFPQVQPQLPAPITPAPLVTAPVPPTLDAGSAGTFDPYAHISALHEAAAQLGVTPQASHVSGVAPHSHDHLGAAHVNAPSVTYDQGFHIPVDAASPYGGHHVGGYPAHTGQIHAGVGTYPPAAGAICADLRQVNASVAAALSQIGVSTSFTQAGNGIRFEVPLIKVEGGQSVANANFVLPTISHNVMSYPTLFIQVIGHTAKTGSDARDLKFTDTLAAVIGKQLREQGVDASRVQTRGFGSRQSWKSANKERAEFRITTAKNCPTIFSGFQGAPYAAFASPNAGVDPRQQTVGQGSAQVSGFANPQAAASSPAQQQAQQIRQLELRTQLQEELLREQQTKRLLAEKRAVELQAEQIHNQQLQAQALQAQQLQAQQLQAQQLQAQALQAQQLQAQQLQAQQVLAQQQQAQQLQAQQFVPQVQQFAFPAPQQGPAQQVVTAQVPVVQVPVNVAPFAAAPAAVQPQSLLPQQFNTVQPNAIPAAGVNQPQIFGQVPAF